MTLQSCSEVQPAVGSMVLLTEQPDGYMSQYAPVTVGKEYEVLGYMGSCLIVSTDVEGETTSLWRGRFSSVVD